MSTSPITRLKDFIRDLYVNKLSTEARRFIVVGVIATALHYGIFFILNFWMSYKVAYSIGYFTSLIVNYFLSNYYTFESKPNVLNSLGFAASHGINYCLHILLMVFFVEWIGLPEWLAPGFVYPIAIVVNFFLVRFALTSRWFMNK